jgi:NAD(P)H-hydrate epimerase
LIQRLVELAVPVVAVDGPSGLDLSTGVQHGPLAADLTVTFGGYRRGHLLARDEVGTVVVVDIGFPPPDPDWPTLFTGRQARAALPPFAAGVHKGQRGRVVVVGGSEGMTGAARLAARAAFAAGAGLVHVVAPPASVATLASAEPDLQTCAQDFDTALEDRAAALIQKADAVVVGPGLGQAPGRRALVLAVLARARHAVLDADGLIACRGAIEELAVAAAGRWLVLTPHLGEFRSLFPDLAAEATVDPWGAAARAADRVQATVLLKGVPTVIARPGRPPVTVAAGNPGLATGGSGDTLSGLVATFLAQQVEPVTAAALGASAMGDAADRAAARWSVRTIRPMDVIEALPEVWRGWELVFGDLALPRPPVLHELERVRKL